MNSNTTQKSDSLVSLDTASLVILVIAMCSQLDVRHVGPDTWGEGLGFMTKTLAVALSDVVFAGVVAWFVVRTAQLNAWSKLWWPPLACWALALAAVVALTHSVTIHDSVIAKLQPAPGHHHGHGLRYALFHNNDQTRVAFAVVVQFIGYFLFGPWVFVNLLHDRRGGELVSRRRAALLSLLGITAAGAALGLLQAFIFHKPPLPTEVHLGDDALAVYFGAPRGLYGTPNIYAGCLAFVLPLLWAWAASGSKGVGLTGLKPSTGLGYRRPGGWSGAGDCAGGAERENGHLPGRAARGHGVAIGHPDAHGARCPRGFHALGHRQ